jgi:hypothetical protein
VRRFRTQGVTKFAGGGGALKSAEATLTRLRQRQCEDEAADEALDALDGASGPDLVAQKLETAGFGDATRPTAKAVMERLKQRQQAQKSAA